MRTFAALMVLILTGCGSKVAPAVNTHPQTDYTDQEIASSVRVGYPENPGKDAYNQGKMSDKELVELEARRHQAKMSNIATQAITKDMRDAEQKAEIAAGLREQPLTEAQRAQRLADIRKAMEDIKAWENRDKANPVTEARPAPSCIDPTPRLGMTLVQYNMDFGNSNVQHYFLVKAVAEGSPADRAGVRDGDVLVGINGYYFSEGSFEWLDKRLKSMFDWTNPNLNVLRGPDFKQEVRLSVK